MKLKKEANENLNNVSGGSATGIFDRLRYRVIEHVCPHCGEVWEYKQDIFKPSSWPLPLTNSCPKCIRKQLEEALKKQNANDTNLVRVSNEDFVNISGGEQITDKDGNTIFKNVCTTCGKTWEYKLEKGEDYFPNWATGPWCPECRKKQQEEFFKKNQTEK